LLVAKVHLLFPADKVTPQCSYTWKLLPEAMPYKNLSIPRSPPYRLNNVMSGNSFV